MHKHISLHGDYIHIRDAINLVENLKVEKVIFNCGKFNEFGQDLITVLDKKKISYCSFIKEINQDNTIGKLIENMYWYDIIFMGDDNMNIEEKILSFLKSQKIVGKYKLSNIKLSKYKNKNDEQLFCISAANLEQPIGNCYGNTIIYYGFNQNGDYVGYVRAFILNVNPPSKIEIEYCANKQYENQGNITTLASEVIKDIFDEMIFDGLKVRNSFPVSCINSIVVSINSDNYASLAVARKLGFNEQGQLEKNKYLSSKVNSSGIKL